MKRVKLFLFVILSINGFIASCQPFTFQQQISSSSNDAEEKFDGSYVTTTSSDIEMMYDSWNSQGLQKIGLRFDNITIPSNATISNAYIQFTADGNSSGSMSMTIEGEDVANSLAFLSGTSNISNRATTSSNVAWSSIPSWVDGASGINQKTPDLSLLVSEIMTSNGWQSGNPITFIINGTGSSAALRKAYSFDGNSSKSAELIIEYASNSNFDLALTAIITPGNSNYPNPASIVQAEIFNYGNLTASSYNVSFSINGNLIANEPVTTPLILGQTTTFTFAQTANLNAVGTYIIDAEVTINNDEDTINNVLSKSISVVNEVDMLFFNQGSSWNYWDSGSNPGASWNTLGFNASSWQVGTGHFGFGEGDEQTTLNNGLESYYFRKKVNIPDVNQLNQVYFHMVHDDGAVIYINGQEAVRTEMMPLGTISHTTTARQSSNTTNENNFYTYKVSSNYFLTGINTIAVSMHNRSTTNDDVSFDCYVTSSYLYDQDGPYVYYIGNDIIVDEVTPNGLVSNTYASKVGLQLTCQLPHMGTSFSFNLKPQITTEPSTYSSTPSKFLTISDFDGHIEGFTMILKGEGIIDNNFNWIYGNGHLIITGDLFDRGFHITECMWLLYKLESEAAAQGGKVHLIIGNHEIFNLTDDWRYVETKYFNNAHLMGKRMSELYDSNTELGRWLRSKNIIEKIGDYAFMHGGLSPQVSALNLTYNQINNYGRLEMNGTPCPNNDCNIINGSDGVYWYRGMAQSILAQQQVDTILANFGIGRVVIGHTKDNTIHALYNDKVMAIDMYHVDNFNDGYMEALKFELGCFYLFHTDGTNNNNYTQLGNCDNFTTNILELNGRNQLKIYPNPASDFLTIEIPKNILEEYNYTIINQTGKKVAQGKINSNLSQIDVSAYSAGKYILTLQNSKSIITGHFILRH